MTRTLFPSVKDGPNLNLFTKFSIFPPLLNLIIEPRFGNQINIYNSTIQVVYEDWSSANINIAIIVKASYPHLLSEPNFTQSFYYG